MDPAALVDSLRAALADRKDVVAVYLFGRGARSELQPHDAIELAVAIAPGPRDEVSAVDALQAELARRLQRRIRVVDLGGAGLGMLERVRRFGVQVGGAEPTCWSELFLAAQRLRRRLWFAVAFANAIVLNEILLQFGPGGLRLPGPTFEHLVRVPLLVLPWILSCVPSRGPDARGMPWLLAAVVMVPAAMLAGLVGTVLVVLLVAGVETMPLGSAVIGALLLACVAWLVAGVGWRRRLATCLLCVAYVPPTLLAGTVVYVVPPRIVAQHAGRHGSFVVEARQQSFDLAMPLHVGSLHVVVPGLLTWWRQLSFLPARAHEIQLHEEGDELVVDYLWSRYREEGVPAQLRLRVR